MFDNLLLIAGIIIVLWVGALIYYLASSRKQIELQDSIESLRALLGENGEDL